MFAPEITMATFAGETVAQAHEAGERHRPDGSTRFVCRRYQRAHRLRDFGLAHRQEVLEAGQQGVKVSGR